MKSSCVECVLISSGCISKHSQWSQTKLVMVYDIGIHFMPAKFQSNLMTNTVSNSTNTDMQGVAAYSHFLINFHN